MNDERLELAIRETLRCAAPREIPLRVEMAVAAIPEMVAPEPKRWRLAARLGRMGRAVLAAGSLALVVALLGVWLPPRTAPGVGTDWQQLVVTGLDGRVLQVASGQGGLLAVGERENASDQPPLVVWASADGRAWHVMAGFEGLTVADPTTVAVCAWGGGFVVVVGDRVWASTDGRSWTTASLGTGAHGRSVTTRGDTIVVVGEEPPATPGDYVPASWTSLDGRTWSKANVSGATSSLGTFWGAVGASDAFYAWGRVYDTQGTNVDVPPTVAGDRLGGAPWYSGDGLNWSQVPDPEPFAEGQIAQIAATDVGLVALGRTWNGLGASEAAVWVSSSSDGTFWRRIATPLPFGRLGDTRLRLSGGPARVAVFAIPGDRASGELPPTVPVAPNVSGTAARLWLSSDGTSWDAVQGGPFAGSQLLEILPFDGGLLAIGERVLPAATCARGPASSAVESAIASGAVTCRLNLAWLSR